MAWCGVGLSLLSIVASVGLSFVYFKAFRAVKASFASIQSAAGGGSEWEGVQAPDITVTNLDGKAIRLSELKGKRVVLDFWATWCGPCVGEIPDFVRLQNEHPDDLVIVGISEESPALLKEFAKKKAVNYSIVSAKGLPAPFSDFAAVPTTFFIDRKGVIQAVVVGSHDYAGLKELALAKDFVGQVAQKPAAPPASGLTDADVMLQPVLLWSTNLSGASAVCSGDWEGDGTAEILVAAGNRLHVLNRTGAETHLVSLPQAYTVIQCGQHGQGEPRLLAYSNWGHEVDVLDKTGKQLWSYSSMMGVDGAQWGDLDGDGKDELIVGMNGFGGFDAVGPDGKKIWHAALPNVWGQAVIPAAPGRPAQVFATEASGSVRVFDAKGQPVRTLHPEGAYCTKLEAAVMDRSGRVQIVALGQGHGAGAATGQNIAFDSTGQVAWSAPASGNIGSPGTHFTCGDIEGKGDSAWAFIQPSGDLVFATSDGHKLAAIPPQSRITDFGIVPGATNTPALVVVLRGASVQAYSFKQPGN
jgi:peroxiredoxin